MNVFVIFQCHACTDTAKACCAILDNYASAMRNVLNSVASPSSWPIIRMQAGMIHVKHIQTQDSLPHSSDMRTPNTPTHNA